MSIRKKILMIFSTLLFTGRLFSYDLGLVDCHPFYVGVDAGWCGGIGRSTSQGSGTVHIGKNFDAHAQSGWIVNTQVGYKFNQWSRAEIQYVYFKNSYKWVTDFGGGDVENFTSKIASHLALVNYHLDLGSSCYPSCFKPYITGGIGLAFNTLSDIEERSPFGFNFPSDVVFANIESHTHTNFCAQVGMGVSKSFYRRLLVNLKFNAYYLGTIKSGNTRDLVNSSVPAIGTQIGPYKFENIWMGSFTLGIGYLF